MRIPSLLRRNAEFRRYFLGQSVSLLGDQVTLIALPLTAVHILHAGAAEMGALTTAYLIPNLIFSLHAGVWVDRRGRRREVMLATDAGRALLIVSIPVAYAFGDLTWTQLYIVAFGTGALSVFFYVAFGGFFQALVPRESYVEAHSLLNGSRAFSFLAGNTLGGALVQLLRGPYALLADGLSFVWSALLLGRVRVEEPPGAPRESGGIRSGARWLWRTRIVRDELLGVATLNFFNFIFSALFILYVTRHLHLRALTLGLVLGAGSVGTVAASMAAAPLARRIGLGRAFVLGCFLFPAPLVLIPAAGGPRWLVLTLLFAAEFLSGIGLMILDISAGALGAGVVPPAMRSRVSGAFMVVNNGVRPLGTATAGILGTLIGLRPTLWIGTLGALAGILWLLPSPLLNVHDVPEVID